MYRVFDRTYVEESDTYPTPPARALTLRPGEVFRQRWTGKGFEEYVERRASSPLAAAALPRRPKPPELRPASLAAPAAADGGERGYVVLRRDEVPHRLRLRAEGALRVARDALLGGREPSLFFYRLARAGERPDFTKAGDILGVARPWSFQVGLRIDGSTRPADVAESTYHECAHLAGLPEDECERLARDLVMRGL